MRDVTLYQVAITKFAEADVSDDVGDIGVVLQKVFRKYLGSSKINMYLCSKNENNYDVLESV